MVEETSPAMKGISMDGSKSEQAVAFGNRLKQARLEMGMEQQELAELMHVTSRSVQAWESGDTLPWKRVDEISRILSAPEHPRSRYWFLHGEEVREPGAGEPLMRRLLANSDQMLECLQAIAQTNQAILSEIRSLRTLDELRVTVEPKSSD